MRSHNSEGSEIDYMDADTYKSHPCHRDCLTGQEPMICSYTFLVINLSYSKFLFNLHQPLFTLLG